MSGDASRRNGQKGGRPKGATKNTLDKVMARERLRQRVIAQLDPMTDAIVASVLGLKYLVTRDKHGKFVKVTAAMAGALTGEEIIEVWEKEPSVQAFTDLMNRALDKPAEQVKVTGADDGPVEHVFRWQK